MPGAGKTSLARAAGERLGLPVIEKDALKETLFDTLGVDDVEMSQRLGPPTYALLFTVARAMLAAGGSLVLEANFFRGTHEGRFASLPPHRLLQAHCYAPVDVIVARYASRAGTRHPGHHDAARAPGLVARYESGLNGPLDVEGQLLELDTTRASVGELADRVVAAANTLR